MKQLDNLLFKKLQLLGEGDSEKDLNPFYVSKEEVKKLLEQKSDEHEKVFERLEILCSLFNLSDQEKEIISIVLAPLLDNKYKKIYAYLHDDLNKKFPTIALVSSLVSHDGNESTQNLTYFSQQSPLMVFKLIEVVQANEQINLYDAPLKISDSVRDFLFGFYTIDATVKPFCSLVSLGNGQHDLLAEDTVFHIKKGLEENSRFLVSIYGETSSQKQKMALEIALAVGYDLLHINTALALEYFDSIAELLPVLYREAVLSDCLLYFDQFDAFFEHEKYSIFEQLLFQQLDTFSFLTFFSSVDQWKLSSIPQKHMYLELPLKTDSYEDKVAFWKEHLQQLEHSLKGEVSEVLESLFTFTYDEIEEIMHILHTKKTFGEEITPKRIYEVCRQRVSVNLEGLAQHIRSENHLEDIVLQNEAKEQMKTVLNHYKNQYTVFEKWGFKKQYQSQGLSILFTGPPGTGKTMAASILANELKLDLYRIELSRVVSKYIGETEKNLSKIFDAAQGSGVVLFFDEADAIFGKRSETKDAHDRYANIEVSYLLQKIEEYDGLVILASNFRQNIDEAFMRRIRFIVNFPFPDDDARELIWKKVFPKDSPLEKKIDFALLSQKFALSGANIRNVALFAAFFAVEQQDEIQMEHIVQGLKIELTKIGKRFKPVDFTSLYTKDFNNQKK
jgi:ATP-dependent 26S proteasome regulatory subunit